MLDCGLSWARKVTAQFINDTNITNKLGSFSFSFSK